VPETEEQRRYVLDWRDHEEDPFGPLTLAMARTLRERFHGCLLGLACGDALGATLQFRASNQFPQVTDMLGGGHWSLQPGAWTDDTAMALCLADSLLETAGLRAGRSGAALSPLAAAGAICRAPASALPLRRKSPRSWPAPRQPRVRPRRHCRAGGSGAVLCFVARARV
jgi:hypothetical protein